MRHLRQCDRCSDVKLTGAVYIVIRARGQYDEKRFVDDVCGEVGGMPSLRVERYAGRNAREMHSRNNCGEQKEGLIDNACLSADATHSYRQ